MPIETISVHRHDRVNPLVNPVRAGDHVIAESGQRFIVRQNLRGDFWLDYAAGGHLTQPVSGQVGICMQIAELENL